MPISRTKKASRNIITSTLLEIVTMISGLVLPRFILQYFGSAYNGITSSATQFLSMISVLTLGVTASTRVALYKTIAKKDTQGTSAIMRATERYMRKIALILGAYIIGLAFLYPWIAKTEYPYWDVVLLIVIVGINSFAEYFFGISYRTFLLADQSVYVSNIFSILAVVLNIGVSVVLIVSGCSIQIVKLGSAVVYVLRPLLQNIYVTRKYHLDKHCEPDMSALNKRGDAMMHALANIVHDNTDIVVLTIFTSFKVVSVYTVYNLVMTALKKFLAIFTSGTEPIFGSMWANGEKEKIGKNLSVFEFFVNAFSAVAFGVAMVMILPFIKLYIPRNVTDINYLLPSYAVVISLAFATQGMRTPYLTLVQGIGHYKETRNAAIIEAAINLTLSIILVNLIGIVGVAIGTLAANIYRTFHYGLYIDRHVVRRGIHVFALNFLWTMVCICIIVIPSGIVVNGLTITSWLLWIGIACVVGVYAAAVVLTASFVFYRKDLYYAFHVLKAMIRRKTKRAGT